MTHVGEGRCPKHVIDVAWKPPPISWINLNTHGAANLESGRAGCCGLLREPGGNWIAGFAKQLGQCNAYVAALWGVYEGLLLAKERGYCHIEMKVDSIVVVRSCLDPLQGGGEGLSLLRRIRSIKVNDLELNIIISIVKQMGVLIHLPILALVLVRILSILIELHLLWCI